MRRVAVQRLARLSARYTLAWAPLSSAAQAADTEGPRVNYTLNWALCAKGVAPRREAYRNLRESQLKKLNATIPGGSRLFVQAGATVLVFVPESVIRKNATLLKPAVSSDLGLVCSKEGVARLFATNESGASNLYKAPASVVLVTTDRERPPKVYRIDSHGQVAQE